MIGKVLMFLFIVGTPLLLTFVMYRIVPEGYEDGAGFHYGRPPGER